MVLDDIMNFALRGKFVDSETKLLSAPSAHAGSNLPRKVCRRGKEGVGGREKIDPEKQGKRKKISSNQSRMNLSSIIARDASLLPIEILQVQTSSLADRILCCSQAGENKKPRLMHSKKGFRQLGDD